VGFGAQNLVKDVINGVAILIENQYGRGDFVRLAGVSGIVEDINLRRTVLRDFDGAVHFVSHSLVNVTSNYTRGYSLVTLGLTVASSEDLDRVFELVDQVGQELAADPAYSTRIRQPPKATRIERLGDASLEVRVEAITEPGEQWSVAGALRRRLKRALDAAGIRASDATP
jgi:small conductance mechanosensitive channel